MSTRTPSAPSPHAPAPATYGRSLVDDAYGRAIAAGAPHPGKLFYMWS